ncbi:unnamed protein product [Adineta steineri]|uniref:Uncharacterized protein n=1 Tax=Adineta steineri TaxID=433720 RepID=A0A819GN03_9BILA|nr:unnamed protein product [Adineta steineri]CAF3889016.1 unnamed protein product [Adineta steineri]
MALPTDRKKHMILCICVIFLIAWKVEGQTTNSPSISCSKSQLLCGGNLCYDPTTQYCSALGTVIQCIAACGNQCYNPATQQCFNGTLCYAGQQLCNVKYDAVYGTPYTSSSPVCYDPNSQSCINNFLCISTQICNGRCMGIRQVCADNTTICNVTNNYPAYQPNQIKLCNGVCYDSTIQQCKNNILSCLNTCAGVCFNSSTQQCFNGTLCYAGQQLCNVKYDAVYGTPYTSSSPVCYDPNSQSCINNFLCISTQICNGRCMGIRQVCAANTTICNVTNNYPAYQPNQIKLCNGVCYDSTTQKCVGGYVVNCILDPSTQQCINQSTTTTTTAPSSTTTSSNSSGSCPITDCTADADCCVSGKEYQCFKHNNEVSGYCLNPTGQSISTQGCPTQGSCTNDIDCCKCKCVTVTKTNGNVVTTKRQCVSP